MDREGSTHPSNDGGKVKKSRKRPKMGSCIPCAKRRQKCDRTHPCSSCVDRGTAHLCKWESISGAFAPPRPGTTASRVEVDLTSDGMDDADVDEDEINPALRDTKLDLDENSEVLKMLSRKIRDLENRFVAGSASATSKRTSVSSDPSMASGSAYANAAGIGGMFQTGPFTGAVGGVGTSFDYGAPTPSAALHELSPSTSPTSLTSPPSHVHAPTRPQGSRRQSETSSRVPSIPQGELYKRIAAFSLVHRGEFLGRGNLLCSLHSIHSSSHLRFPPARMVAPVTIQPPHPTKFTQTLIPTPEIQHLVQYLPCMPSTNLMIDAFFKEVNWRYGIPGKWFLNTCNQMWTDLQNPTQAQHLNLHWLCLLFSVLACTPRPGETPLITSSLPNTHDSTTYFVCASTARRLTEDDLLDRPVISLDEGTPPSSPVDGSVLVCLAIPLLCDFLAERGKVSEAWKLVGGGVRAAQAIGLHRDPGSQMWQEMPEEEKDLRRRAWWGLYIWDRLLSHILGRPQMLREDSCDVAKPSSIDGKGRKNSFILSRMVLIQLTDLASEVLDKCMGTDHPTWTVLTGMDAKFENWETGIPAEFRPGTTQEQDIILFAGLSQPEIQNFTRQRYMITTWYRLIRLKIHTLTLRQHQLPPSTTTRTESPGHILHCAEKCIRSALELMKFQCDTFECMRRTQFCERWVGGNWYFEGCLSLFEAAIALLLTLTKFPTMFLVPPGANMVEETKKGLRLEYEDMTRSISRVVDVFSEVVISERESENGVVKDGKRGEIPAKALETLRILLKEHWWKLDPRGEAGKPPLTAMGLGSYIDGGFATPQASVSPSGSGSSPQRADSSPGMNMISGGGAPYGGGYLGSNIGPMFPSHPGPVPSAGQGQQPGSTQSYSTLAPPIEPKSVPPSIQQQMSYQAYQSPYYVNAPQYSTMTKTQVPSFSRQFSGGSSVPVTTATTSISYSQYSPDFQGEAAVAITSPATPSHSQNQSQHHYTLQPQAQPQSYSDNFSFPGMDGTTAYLTQFPFTPLSSQNQNQSNLRNQNQGFQGFPPAPQPPFPVQSTSQLPSSMSNNPAYGYNLMPPGGATRPSSGTLPSSQGMRMIHYVVPGSKTPSSTASTTTTTTTHQSSFGIPTQEPVKLEPGSEPGSTETQPQMITLNEFVPLGSGSVPGNGPSSGGVM